VQLATVKAAQQDDDGWRADAPLQVHPNPAFSVGRQQVPTPLTRTYAAAMHGAGQYIAGFRLPVYITYWFAPSVV
jgi:hypothetical protein